MSLAAQHSRVRRSLRRLLLEVASPVLLRRPRCVLAVCALLLLAPWWRPLRTFLLPRYQADGDGAAVGDHGGLRGMLREDLELHGQEYWRMLLPGQHSGLEAFVEDVARALRARPLGTPCLDYALSNIAPNLDRESLWLEFGVWTGRSLSLIGKASKQLGRSTKVFGFDSFKGLPEHWRNSTFGEKWEKKWTAQGAFDLGGQAPEWFVDQEAAEFVVGWFNESLPPFLERFPGRQVSFVHVDSDLYSSAALVLELVTPRLRPGSLIVFDELINYPGFRGGEIRALYEFLESPVFKASGLTGVQVVGYRGPNLLLDDAELADALAAQRGEGRKYPQDAVFQVF